MTKGQQAVAWRDAGMSNREIADKLGMDPKSVRRLISEARQSRHGWPSWSEARETSQPAHQGEWSKQDAGIAEMRVQVPPRPTKPRSHLIIPDTQAKPGVSDEHMYWAGRYAAERRPDVIVHLGDHWDFPSLSSYEKPGSKWFEGKRLCGDIEAGNRALEQFERGLGGYQPQRKVLLRGNHENRLTRAINDEPKLEGLVGFDNLNDRALGWEVVDFLQPVEIDGVWYCHYFANPRTGRPYSGNPETMLKNVSHSFTMGHQQGLSVARRELATGQVQRALIAGSYYLHDEAYLGPQGNRHWRGLLVCHEVHEGSYDLMEVSIGYLAHRFQEKA